MKFEFLSDRKSRNRKLRHLQKEDFDVFLVENYQFFSWFFSFLSKNSLKFIFQPVSDDFKCFSVENCHFHTKNRLKCALPLTSIYCSNRPWTELMMECFPDVVEEEEEEMMAKEYGRKEETSYECQMCNVILKPWGNNRWNLKMHVISMHCVSKQYKCRTCGFLVSRKTSARQHSRRIHGKDEDPEDLMYSFLFLKNKLIFVLQWRQNERRVERNVRKMLPRDRQHHSISVIIIVCRYFNNIFRIFPYFSIFSH